MDCLGYCQSSLGAIRPGLETTAKRIQEGGPWTRGSSSYEPMGGQGGCHPEAQGDGSSRTVRADSGGQELHSKRPEKFKASVQSPWTLRLQVEETQSQVPD